MYQLVIGPDSDIVTMYDTAWRQQPGNDELAIHTFSANARTGNWKAAQQACTYNLFRVDFF